MNHKNVACSYRQVKYAELRVENYQLVEPRRQFQYKDYNGSIIMIRRSDINIWNPIPRKTVFVLKRYPVSWMVSMNETMIKSDYPN